jgi:heme oxygenase
MTNGGQTLDTIKAATWNLHTKAERGGIIAEIFGGRANRAAIALFLRNLLPVYEALEAGLGRFSEDAVMGPIGHPALARSMRLQADLTALRVEPELPVLPEAALYRDQIQRAADGDGSGLIAHAYVRYLGDLNGGLIIRRRLIVCIGAEAERLTFSEYDGIVDFRGFTAGYRAALDRALHAACFDRVAAEAKTAFEMNIALSDAVAAYRPL